MIEEGLKRQSQSGRRYRRVALAAALLCAVAFGVWRYTLHHRLATKLASIRAAGYPTTLTELDASYRMATGANAADVYQLAFDAYVEDEKFKHLLPGFHGAPESVDFPAPGEPLPADMAEAMLAHLAQNARVLALLAEAAKIPECRFPVDLTQGLEVLLTHVRRLRRCANLLAIQATVEGHLGQGARATESIEAILALADSLRNEPILASQIARISMEASGRLTIECLLGQVRWTDEQLVDLSRAIARSFDDRAMPRAVASERAILLAYWETYAPPSAFTEFVGIADADRLAYLQIMDANMVLTESPIGDPSDLRVLLQDIPWYSSVTRPVAPNLEVAGETRWYADTHTRVVLVGLAVKRYQLAHDRLPQRLDELVSEYLDAVPADPFDAKPLRYKRTDTGAVIYSIGQDGIDNGGTDIFARKDRAWDTPDWVDTDIAFRIQ